VALSLFQGWWPLEGIQCLEVNGEASLFGGQWKVPSLVAFRMKNKNILFTPFHFSLQKILLKFFSH
jgi:hypothetical protein